MRYELFNETKNRSTYTTCENCNYLTMHANDMILELINS